MSACLFVISAPSGGGKSTIINSLLREYPELCYSISLTTRPPRGDEQHGREYYFTDTESFQKKIEEGAFLEWALVHGCYYGTLRESIFLELKKGRSIILDIDVQGGLQIKEKMPEAVLIFIKPPSLEVLEKRLRSRKTDSNEVIKMRLKNAIKEIAVADKYNFCIINDLLDVAVLKIKQIIDSFN
ncbi:guanylate kinase [bacterium]|nr:guanylate kinase [bacterium]